MPGPKCPKPSTRRSWRDFWFAWQLSTQNCVRTNERQKVLCDSLRLRGFVVKGHSAFTTKTRRREEDFGRKNSPWGRELQRVALGCSSFWGAALPRVPAGRRVTPGAPKRCVPAITIRRERTSRTRSNPERRTKQARPASCRFCAKPDNTGKR